MQRIFGTPQEPLFNHKYAGITPDVLQEWLVSLAQENLDRITNASSYEGIYKDGNISEFIFLTCERLKMAPEAQFLALEIFERFMMQHIQDLHKFLSKPGHKSNLSEWKTLQNHAKLRAVSCCQIASKLTSHYKVVTVARAKRFLVENGHRYTSNGILQSELRVLKTLDFWVAFPSALTYIETLLEILGYNDKGTEVKVYHAVAMKILSVFYIKHTHMYEKLYEVTVKTPTLKQQQKFKAVKADKMLLATSVIVASVYIADQYSTDRVAEHLSKISRIPCDDILDFATVMVQIILDEN